MGLRNFIKNVFSQRQPTTKSPKTTPIKQPMIKQKTLTSQTLVQAKVALTTVDEPVKTTTKITKQKNISIEISYLDEDGNPLRPAIKLNGYEGDDLAIPWETFPERILSHILNYQQQFFTNENGIQLIFRKQLAGPLIIYDRDQWGKLLREPRFIYGDLNNTYEVTPIAIEGYSPIEVPPNAAGYFLANSQQITFYYRNLNFLPVEETHPFVQMKHQTTAMKEPNGEKLSRVLPRHSVWKRFDTFNVQDQVWHHLGGNVWVPEVAVNLLDHNPNIGTNKPATISDYLPKVKSEQPLQATAEIQYMVGAAVSNWTAPLGDILKSRTPHGTQIKLISSARLDNDSLWYQSADNIWFEARYVHLLNKEKTTN